MCRPQRTRARIRICTMPPKTARPRRKNYPMTVVAEGHAQTTKAPSANPADEEKATALCMERSNSEASHAARRTSSTLRPPQNRLLFHRRRRVDFPNRARPRSRLKTRIELPIQVRDRPKSSAGLPRAVANLCPPGWPSFMAHLDENGQAAELSLNPSKIAASGGRSCVYYGEYNYSDRKKKKPSPRSRGTGRRRPKLK